jgi:hypothetical protein
MTILILLLHCLSKLLKAMMQLHYTWGRNKSDQTETPTTIIELMVKTLATSLL